MQLIIDFASSRPGGRMFIVSQSRLLAATVVFIVLMLVTAGAFAYGIAVYWVTHDTAIIRVIAAQEIRTQDEDRHR